MAKILSETHNSTETFFGGGMGVLTVSKRKPKNDSKKNSETREQPEPEQGDKDGNKAVPEIKESSKVK